MKTAILMLVPLLLAAAPSRAQEGNRNFEEITGAVSSVRVVYPHQLKRGKTWVDGAARISYRNMYDAKNRVTEESEYSGKQLALKKQITHLDQAAAAAFCSAVKSGQAPDTSFAETDGSALARFCKNNAKKKFEARFEHDATSPTRPQADRLIRRVFIFPDSKGRPAEEFLFDMIGAFESRTVRKFAKDGSIAEEVLYDPEGLILSRTVHSRNKAARVETVSVFNDRAQLISKTVKAFRETGLLRKITETTFDEGEQELRRTETSYDQKGLRASEARYTGGAADADYEYEYSVKADKKGNWTRETRRKFVNFRGSRLPAPGEAPQVIVRDITYR